MLDLDGFKRINDIAGHLAGDRALATVGKVLRQATRGSDIVGRYGGDEFAVILPQSSEEGARAVGQRILDALQDKHVAGPEGDLSLRGSIGLSVLAPHNFPPVSIPRPVPNAYFQEMAQVLIHQADSAMYAAKHGGGFHLHVSEPVAWMPVTTPPEALSVLEEA